MPCSASKAWTGWPGGSSISAETDGRILAAADQPGVGARAERQPERIEQDRLAGAGLAGEHAQPGVELELELVDEHDVADGELPQHGALAR